MADVKDSMVFLVGLVGLVDLVVPGHLEVPVALFLVHLDNLVVPWVLVVLDVLVIRAYLDHLVLLVGRVYLLVLAILGFLVDRVFPSALVGPEDHLVPLVLDYLAVLGIQRYPWVQVLLVVLVVLVYLVPLDSPCLLWLLVFLVLLACLAVLANQCLPWGQVFLLLVFLDHHLCLVYLVHLVHLVFLVVLVDSCILTLLDRSSVVCMSLVCRWLGMDRISLFSILEHSGCPHLRQLLSVYSLQHW